MQCNEIQYNNKPLKWVVQGSLQVCMEQKVVSKLYFLLPVWVVWVSAFCDHLSLNYHRDTGQKEYLSLTQKFFNLCLFQEVLHIGLCSKCKSLHCQSSQKQMVLKQHPPTQQSTLFFNFVIEEVVN
jgi:hypothetical protein